MWIINFVLGFVFFTFFILNSLQAQEPYKAVIWNIQKAKHNLWEKSFFDISIDADFLLVQEAVDNKLVIGSVKTLFPYIRYYESWRNKKVSSGLLNASFIEPVRNYVFKSPSLEPIARTPKLISAEIFNLEGVEILILNIHAINFKAIRHFKKHINTVSSLINEHVGPIIFAGDFNTWSRARKLFLDDFSKSKGLSEIKFSRNELFLELDHIYARGIKVINVEQINLSTSDHDPMTLTFSIE